MFYFKVDKIVQLYETMMTRHSTMIVGPTGGGKSVVIQTLAQAQTALGLPTKIFTLNPKVSTNNLLYTVHYVSCAGKRPHKSKLYVLVMEIFKCCMPIKLMERFNFSTAYTMSRNI